MVDIFQDRLHLTLLLSSSLLLIQKEWKKLRQKTNPEKIIHKLPTSTSYFCSSVRESVDSARVLARSSLLFPNTPPNKSVISPLPSADPEPEPLENKVWKSCANKPSLERGTIKFLVKLIYLRNTVQAKERKNCYQSIL